MKKIKHVMQPTPNTCVSACIAMLLDIPVETVIEEFHDLYVDNQMNADEYLELKGMSAYPLLSTYRQVLPGNTYLICAPSLNLEGATHEIIMDFRTEFRVYDPNMGREGKKYYVWKNGENLGELEVDIKGYSFDFWVDL